MDCSESLKVEAKFFPLDQGNWNSQIQGKCQRNMEIVKQEGSNKHCEKIGCGLIFYVSFLSVTSECDA